MANVKYLRERAELLRETRLFFDQRGFIEVQPPCLSRDCVVDAYLDPVTVDARDMMISDPRMPERFYLQTSPESAMKRLLVDGAPSIYSVGPVFRGGESGRLHNVEFTMLEWYELGGDVESAMSLTGDFVSQVLGADGCDRVTYRRAFRDHIGVDPIDAPTEQLRRLVESEDRSLADSIGDDRDELLDVLLSTRITSQLGMDRPLLLTEYPLDQAALAKPSETDPSCAARFELYVRGVEVANGYDELLDAEVMRARFDKNNCIREQTGRDPLVAETTLVKAMRRGLPACSGVALGIDRLLMLRVGAETIDDVLPFMIWNA
ncbi:MAG: EF-P lysine aminoacylase GenX [Planctomycetales bacterium]|nr:EF-P lysine aminoacylase GenX [Planctomycetales bacterium]